MNQGPDSGRQIDYVAVAMDHHRRSMGDYRGGNFARYLMRSFLGKLLTGALALVLFLVFIFLLFVVVILVV